MVDIGVWTDEFLYWLFDYLNEMTEEETNTIQRSLTGVSEENLSPTLNQKYYRLVTTQSRNYVM